VKKEYIFPVLLILIGTFLLLEKFDLLSLSRPYILIAGSAILGAILIRKSILSSANKGALAGSFFILLALIFLIINLGYLPSHDEVVWPLILAALGLANIIYYVISRKSFSNITFGLIFIAISVPFLTAYYGNFEYWEIADTFSRYWPILLITFGFGFLIDGVFKKHKSK